MRNLFRTSRGATHHAATPRDVRKQLRGIPNQSATPREFLPALRLLAAGDPSTPHVLHGIDSQ
jgi:hypothetical protein